jgi:hypothetical protein
VRDHRHGARGRRRAQREGHRAGPAGAPRRPLLPTTPQCGNM